MGRDEIADRVARYAQVVRAPVALATEVRRLTPLDGGGFRVRTSRGDVSARQVVVATGSYQTPRIPPMARRISARVAQLHSHDYRNQAACRRAVLVVGSGQTGLQLAEELFEAGRRVYVSVGSAGRVPRRYRGRDIFSWLLDVIRHGGAYGVALPTAEQLPDGRRRFSAMPALTGRAGGHDTNLRRYAADGMTLAGRLAAADGERLTFAGDLEPALERADRFFDERFRGVIDTFIERAGIEAPPADDVAVTYRPAELTELNLADAGVSTVIWATGYTSTTDGSTRRSSTSWATRGTSAESQTSPGSSSSASCGSTRRRRRPWSVPSSTARTSWRRWPGMRAAPGLRRGRASPRRASRRPSGVAAHRVARESGADERGRARREPRQRPHRVGRQHGDRDREGHGGRADRLAIAAGGDAPHARGRRQRGLPLHRHPAQPPSRRRVAPVRLRPRALLLGAARGRSGCSWWAARSRSGRASARS